MYIHHTETKCDYTNTVVPVKTLQVLYVPLNQKYTYKCGHCLPGNVGIIWVTPQEYNPDPNAQINEQNLLKLHF